jgi:hypothetical protein
MTRTIMSALARLALMLIQSQMLRDSLCPVLLLVHAQISLLICAKLSRSRRAVTTICTCAKLGTCEHE